MSAGPSGVRGWAEPALRAVWEGRGGVPGALARTLLLPLAATYRGGVFLRSAGYDRGWIHSEDGVIPVISVGNLTVGGTGKTPVTRWVVEEILRRGGRPAVVARGYGGDEPLLHRRWYPRVPVVLDADRREGVRRAARAGASVAVLDDGFQHRALRRELDVVLVSAEQPIPFRVLPRGPCREPASALRRAHRLIVTRRTADARQVAALSDLLERLAPGVPRSTLRLSPAGWETLSGASCEAPSGPVLVVTGVAGPEGVERLVRSAARVETELMAFPDHHPFAAADLRALARRAAGRVVIVTEKDAVKLETLPLEGVDVRVLTLGVDFEEGGEGMKADVARVLAGGHDAA